jgi:hypothetical protein
MNEGHCRAMLAVSTFVSSRNRCKDGLPPEERSWLLLFRCHLQIDHANMTDLIDALNGLRIRHGLQINAQLRGMITGTPEDEADEDESSDYGSSKDSLSEDGFNNAQIRTCSFY